MQRYVLKRLGYAVISLLLLSATIFLLVRATGDPAILMAEPGAKEEDLRAIRVQFGLDKPLWTQYAVFITNAARGDFGKSIYYRTPAFDLYLQRLPASLWLAGVSMAISLVIGLTVAGINLVLMVNVAVVVRGEVLSLKERDFVRLALVAGCSKGRIMLKHILPNACNSAVVIATLMLGVAIISEASLSFLGVGVAPPKPAWGLMLAEGKSGLMAGYWWLSVFPGACIMLVVLAANLLGDWLRVKFDPQLRQL